MQALGSAQRVDKAIEGGSWEKCILGLSHVRLENQIPATQLHLNQVIVRRPGGGGGGGGRGAYKGGQREVSDSA